ncbi:hypothetical protein ACIBG8_07650 [Nonomuraea sp. NPDC050556]|uniref:hypothetical protein n=1 Tax=Nonomuraea sp. NPDC050556 TaxID=3364369 RepID=UPI0037A87676
MYNFHALKAMADDLAKGDAPSTATLAECLLMTLSALNQAADQTLAHGNNAYGDVRQALIKVLATQDWGPEMAAQAIAFALDQSVSMREGMIATQA